MEMLCRYSWPGNVRELISTIERLEAKARGRIITMDHMRRDIDLEEGAMLAPGSAEGVPELREGETLREYMGRVETLNERIVYSAHFRQDYQRARSALAQFLRRL